MFCRKCGNEIPNDSVFCGKCGFNQKEQTNSSPQSYKNDSPQNKSLFHDGTSGSSESMYFDHSTKAVTIFVIAIAFILVVGIVSTIFINEKITTLEEYYYHYGRYRTELSQMKSLRNWNIFFDVMLIGSLLWRCFLTSKNYLRISGGMLNGICCPPFGFTTAEIRDLQITNIRSVEAKNKYSLVVTTDKNYVFLIEDAEKAYWIIYKKIHEE